MAERNTFPEVWRYLRTHLHPGDVIRNWTALKGYLGDTMTIAKIDEGAITFEAPRARNPQVVPVGDFEVVWQNWADYKIDKVLRSELRDLTRYSKYVISALRWYEEHQKTTIN